LEFRNLHLNKSTSNPLQLVSNFKSLKVEGFEPQTKNLEQFLQDQNKIFKLNIPNLGNQDEFNRLISFDKTSSQEISGIDNIGDTYYQSVDRLESKEHELIKTLEDNATEINDNMNKSFNDLSSEKSSYSLPKRVSRQMSPVKPLDPYPKSLKLSLFKNKSTRQNASAVNDFKIEEIRESDSLSDQNSLNDSKIEYLENESVYNFVQKRSLAIKIHKKETLKNLSTLRKVHSNKIKQERKKVFDMAQHLVTTKTNNLKEACQKQLTDFVSQYQKLHEITIRYVHNEDILINLLVEQENQIVQTRVCQDIIHRLGKAVDSEGIQPTQQNLDDENK